MLCRHSEVWHIWYQPLIIPAYITPYHTPLQLDVEFPWESP